jgi:phage-related protein
LFEKKKQQATISDTKAAKQSYKNLKNSEGLVLAARHSEG